MTTGTTPARQTARRILGGSVEASKDLTQVKVELPDEGAEADITEQIGGKTVTYKGKVKEDGKNTLSLEDEEGLSFLDEKPAPQIPKTHLERLFDGIVEVVDKGEYDSFYASVTRLPDHIGDKFLRPSHDLEELGFFQFSMRDRLQFHSELQRLNGNSGGRFNIAILSQAGTARLRIINAGAFNEVDAGLINHKVANPIKTEADNVNSNGNQPSSELTQLLAKVIERQEATDRKLFEIANRKPEKSALETAIEAKVLNDIVNPPAPQQGSSGIETMMMQMMMLPQMVNGFATRMFPPIPPPVEPDFLDKMMRLADTDMGKNIVDKGGNLISQLTLMGASKALASNAPIAPAPAELGSDVAEGMEATSKEESEDVRMELVNTILDELESDRPIDNTNQAMNNLAARFPDIVPTFLLVCKGASFDQLLQILQSMLPDAFSDYIIPGENGGTYNERGKYIIERLRTFHDFIKKEK